MTWTPPKTWSNEPLVAGDMNTHIRDNLEALKTPPTDSYVLDEVSDYSTTSTSFVDIDSTNLSLSIETMGGDVLVVFHGTFQHSSAGGFVQLDVDVDGTRHAGDDGILVSRLATTAYYYPMGFARLITGLSAGSHTFKLQWKSNGGTLTLYAGDGTGADVHSQFFVREM